MARWYMAEARAWRFLTENYIYIRITHRMDPYIDRFHLSRRHFVLYAASLFRPAELLKLGIGE